MNELATLGLALNSAFWLAAWYRSRPSRALPAALARGRQGRPLAALGLLLQLTAGALLQGVLAGAMLVASAWMFFGLVLVVCANASPKPALGVAAWVGGVGGVAAVLAAAFEVVRRAG